MSTLEGKRLGDYRIIDRIGKGGMAWVYRARHKAFGEVAFKILPPFIPVTLEDRQRFLREARTIKLLDGLDHPSIIKLYEAGAVPSPFSKADDLLFIAMELVPGGTLHQRIHDGTIAQRFLLPMMMDLGDALGMAHAKGIIHRDIKPANILFRANQIPVLCDFGIARLGDATAMTATGMGIGTIDYMAPELLDTRRATASPTTDVYALALTLYEALAGANPFREAGSDLRIIMAEIVQTSPAPIATIVPTLPRNVAALIDRSLSKDPADRPQNGLAFADALRAAGVTPRSGTSSGIPVVAGGRGSSSTAPATPPPSRPHEFIAGPPGTHRAAALAPVPVPAHTASTPQRDIPMIPRRRSRLPLMLAAAVVAIVLLGGAWTIVQPAPVDSALTSPPTITPLPSGADAAAPSSESAATAVIMVTATRTPTAPSTDTPAPSTDTPVPSTDTPVPSATQRPATATARPQPTATRRPVPPTARPAPPTNPPPAQPQPAPTNTPVPPPVQPEPQPQPEAPPPTEAPAIPSEIPVPTEAPPTPTEAPRPTNTPRPPTDTPVPTNTPRPTPCDVRTNPGCAP
ncbi:MAG TPA: protein kinase [Herpetosiphonaceae bacterium]